MRLSFSSLAPLFLYLIQWLDCGCCYALPSYLGLSFTSSYARWRRRQGRRQGRGALPGRRDVGRFLQRRSSKAEQKDALNNIVLLAYLQFLHLQSDGFLTTWTNSFVGPWDPSQGEHNPDEKIKLWLFLPGRHSVVPETAQPAVSKLRVVLNDLWVAPGNSEEVAAALTQALRNSLERSLKSLSYARFDDVFTKYNPPTRNQNNFSESSTQFQIM